MNKVLTITGKGIALERFAREQRLRFKKEGFTAEIGDAPKEDVKDAPEGDEKPEAPAEDAKDAPKEDVKDAPEGDEKTAKKSNKR